MLENAVYSVISPESCAAIIYRDSAKAEQAAAALRLTAEDLKELGLIDGIIPEPAGGAQEDPDGRGRIPAAALERSSGRAGPSWMRTRLVEHRYAKFRRMGNFFA